MKKEEARRELLKDREELQAKLEKAREEVYRLEIAIASIDHTITSLDRTLDLLSGKSPQTMVPIVRISPTDAVRNLFRENPDREFKHAEVGAYLEGMYKQGLLKTRTPKISTNFGYIVGRLIDTDNLIENIGRKGKPIYRLKKIEQHE